jgi:signal transduction histidine kinase
MKIMLEQRTNELNQTVQQLVQAQKLESIGQLAAGIAHEINTPMQYVGDNTRFFKESFSDLARLLDMNQKLLSNAKNSIINHDIINEVESIIREIDLEYLAEEIPLSINQTLEGVERVNKIVRSMKEFSHPPLEDKTMIDINKAIESTITISRNEWKYVSELITEFDENLPLVPCFPGDLNQVFLNMIVNAAHAIQDVVGRNGHDKGIIIISTKKNDEWVEIRIKDTGSGIKPEFRSKIFDLFFTTKKVGRGTGQGLAIAHSIIVEKHEGKLSFETEIGEGTCFIIKLPLQNQN